MTALLVYAAVLLLGIAVVINRRGERRLITMRREIDRDEAAMRDFDRRLAEVRRRAASADQGLRDIEARLAEAGRALEAAERRLAEANRQPVERYYVFDRLEPRPGRIWSVRIAQSAADPISRESRRAAAWGAPRTYLLIAGNRKEAMDRAGLRYSRGAGYDVEDAVTCPLFAGVESVARSGPPAAAPRAPATRAAGRPERGGSRLNSAGG